MGYLGAPQNGWDPIPRLAIGGINHSYIMPTTHPALQQRGNKGFHQHQRQHLICHGREEANKNRSLFLFHVLLLSSHTSLLIHILTFSQATLHTEFFCANSPPTPVSALFARSSFLAHRNTSLTQLPITHLLFFHACFATPHLLL